MTHHCMKFVPTRCDTRNIKGSVYDENNRNDANFFGPQLFSHFLFMTLICMFHNIWQKP